VSQTPACSPIGLCCTATRPEHSSALLLETSPLYRPTVVQYKDRVRPELIKPAVDWRKSPTSVATMSAAVAKQ
jgi:hypothetical protein